MIRFIREYELIITLTSGEVIKLVPEIRVQFEISKSIKGGLNNCTIKIYNLSEDKRLKLVKDKENNVVLMPFLFRAGYDKLQTLFSGNITESFSEKSGTDFITTIKCLDGGFDFINSFTSKVVKSNDVEHIINDMPNTKKGKISKRKKIFRPKVLVGNSAKLIEESLDENETYFIDNGKIHIIKDDEVIDNYIPVVNAKSGLLGTPIKKNKEVSFNTLLNPTLKIGGLVELESLGAKNLNGIYKIISIKYKGDNYGSDWSQDVTCLFVSDYKVL